MISIFITFLLVYQMRIVEKHGLLELKHLLVLFLTSHHGKKNYNNLDLDRVKIVDQIKDREQILQHLEEMVMVKDFPFL